MNIKSMLGAGLLLLLPLAQANALLLQNWNDVDLDASGDQIEVGIGTYQEKSYFSMQWQAGADNELGALGIDTVFYNYELLFGTGDLLYVFDDFLGGNDVTGDWKTNFGGATSGGGFGKFSSDKSLDGGGTDGVSPNSLFFVLDGAVNFLTNGDPTNSTFAAHVRYGDDCSGWVSDGNTESQSSGSCGSTSVPEPGVIGLLAIGLLGLGVARRRTKA